MDRLWRNAVIDNKTIVSDAGDGVRREQRVISGLKKQQLESTLWLCGTKKTTNKQRNNAGDQTRRTFTPRKLQCSHWFWTRILGND